MVDSVNDNGKKSAFAVFFIGGCAFAAPPPADSLAADRGFQNRAAPGDIHTL
jgi:hypothetical protein